MSQNRNCGSRCLRLVTVMALLITSLLPTMTYAQQSPPNRKVFLPLIRSYSMEPLADLAWQWGDASEATGSRGMRVVDWDGDGQNEILLANEQMLVAARHTGDYLFDQFWATSMGVGWALVYGNEAQQNNVQNGEPVDFSGGAVLWIAHADGRLQGYVPVQPEPIEERGVSVGAGFTIKQAELADLQGNGTLVWLMLIQRPNSRFELRTYPLGGGLSSWSYPLGDITDPYGRTPSFITAQVDGDIQSEVILSYGAVIDPVLAVQQWFSADGFTRFTAGDIDSDGREELIYTRPYPFEMRAVDVDTGVIKWRQEMLDDTADIFSALAVLDVDSDGQREVVGGSYLGHLRIRAGVSGNLLRTISSPGPTSAIAMGDADNDGQQDLVWGTGDEDWNPARLLAAPVDRHRPLFTSQDYDGPFVPLPLAMRGRFPLNLAVFSRSTNNGHWEGTYFILDSLTGAVERDLHLPVSDYQLYPQSDPPPGVLLFNLDDDPAMEAVIATISASHDEGILYQVDDDGSLIAQRSMDLWIKPEWAGDVDNDGNLEIVSRSRYGVVVLDSATLATEWESGEPYSDMIYDVAVGDVDGDGDQEILVASERNSLYAIDGVTHLREWQMPGGRLYRAVAVGNADTVDGLEIVTVEDQRLTFYDGATRQLKARTVTLPSTTIPELTLVAMISAPTPQLALATYNQIYLFRRPMDPTPVQVIGLSEPTLVFADVDNDNHLDMMVGHTNGVARYRMRESSTDRLPRQATASTPTPGSTLVSRDASVEATFSEELDETTIVLANAQLRSGGLSLPIAIHYDQIARTLRLTSQSLLPASSLVTVWLGTGLTDLAGNRLDGNNNGIGGEPDDAYAWGFTTGTGVDLTGPVVNGLALTPNPAWIDMPVTLTATADDTNPVAVSVVQAAEYFVDVLGTPGTGTPLAAADGQFDESQEAISGIIDTTGLRGEHVIYVRPQDSAGNWGDARSETVTIEADLTDNWPMFGQNPAHTGFNEHQRPATSFELLWQKDIAATFNIGYADLFPQVAVANGVVVASINKGVTMPGNGGVIALNASTGVELWRRTFVDEHSINPPAISYGKVYFQQGHHTNASYLFALNAITGAQVWSSWFSGQWESYLAPTVADDKVFVNADGGISGFDAENGDRLWQGGASQMDRWTPTYANGTVFSWVGGKLTAWNPTSGVQRWTMDLYPLGTGVAAIKGQRAYVIGGNWLIAVNLSSKTELWRVSGPTAIAPAIADGIVYALQGTQLAAYNATTGAPEWSYETGETLTGAPLVTRTSIFVASQNHTWVIDRASHALVWEADEGGWLTVANDKLFIAQPDGKLFAYRALR